MPQTHLLDFRSSCRIKQVDSNAVVRRDHCFPKTFNPLQFYMDAAQHNKWIRWKRSPDKTNRFLILHLPRGQRNPPLPPAGIVRNRGASVWDIIHHIKWQNRAHGSHRPYAILFIDFALSSTSCSKRYCSWGNYEGMEGAILSWCRELLSTRLFYKGPAFAQKVLSGCWTAELQEKVSGCIVRLSLSKLCIEAVIVARIWKQQKGFWRNFQIICVSKNLRSFSACLFCYQ